MEGDLIELLRAFNADNNSSLQFLKEFQTPDAVYNVYLKKLSYNASRSALQLAQQKSEEVGVASVNFKTKELRIIKAGSLDRLIDSLFLESGDIDGTYVRIFLATFRTFCSPLTLAEKLTQLYLKYEDSGIPKASVFQQSILHLLSIWLDLYLLDFNEPPSYPCLQALRTFLKNSVPNSPLFNRVQHRFSKFCADDEPDDGVCLDGSDSIDGSYTVHGRLFPSPGKSELIEVVEFSQLNARTIAEQLTRIDAELFIKVEAHQCLGSTWNQRSREKANECPTVAATISMFNSVIYTVISTILKDIGLKSSKRANIIEKWISIAQELRIMKNFSSLRAIISGLQSSPIFRLKKLWSNVNKSSMEIYTDLSQIFSLDGNQIASRELLMKEGTAKVSSQQRRKSKTIGIDSDLHRYEQSALCCGTVPYLGTFLSDLTMVDSAFSDYTDNGLVNFEKKRKEFEIVAQITLFQSAAKMYQIAPHRRFKIWFNSMRVYTEDESYALSCEIEAPYPNERSLHKNGSSKSSVSSYTSITLSYSNFSLTSPTPSDRVSIGSASSDSAHPITSQSSISSGDSDVSGNQDRRVIKVTLLASGQDITVNYKSINLTNKDRALAVIRRVLEKFHQDTTEENDPSSFCLVQITDKQRELQLRADDNVYYAMDASSTPFTFLVKKISVKTPKKILKNRSFS
ncbi:ral guanine nucleotide dissociation stimulator-like 1 isoform X2 [Watersipora subatra]|uniref:ral guanine nucleotide dissociation stimulator-like 1 isoform X2 n=1 Tax=Watersipora subatra TaxID=2589382 RepID=UPI00355B4145